MVRFPTVKCVIGVDLGGTNVRAGAFFEDGTEAGPRIQLPSRAQDGTGVIVDAISRAVNEAAASAKVKPQCVGMAVPGHVDDASGVIRWAPNFGETINGIFHSWRDVHLRSMLEQNITLPIHMGNDANLAALGEYMFGSGENKARGLVMITLGTGVGGGVVLSPKSVIGDARGPLMLVGGNGGGGELGHMVIAYQGLDCNAGAYGALEAYCARDSIIMRAVHRIKRDRQSLITELVDGDLSKITPLTISQAAEKGDDLAIEVFQEVGTMLGVGIGNCINVFAPEVLAIGGQIAKAGKYILKPALNAAQNVAIPSLFGDTRVVIATQIDDAGMLGGAALAIEAMQWQSDGA